jgi:peptidoglycan/LPS O-acetylase OafA/YrhL
LANVPFVFGGTISTIVQFWSVAVEEQFYLFWPWLFRWKKNLHLIMLGIIIIYLLLRFILRFVENGNLYTFLGVIQFHSMAIGGLGAWTIHNKKNFIKKLFKPAVQVICWAILAISLFQPIHVFSIIDSELYAIIFIIIILNVSTNPKTLIKLDHPVLNWLGKISYGIYVYHMIAIIIGFKIFRMLFQVSPGREYIAYVLVIATTLIIAQISYNYFESWFLIKKSKFAVIQSTNVKKDINRPGDHKDCTSVSSLSGSVIT